MAGRGQPNGKTVGNVTAFKADSEFLGAEDIMGRGDVPIRIVEVLTYPKGYMVAGRAAAKPFPVVVYERQDASGAWVVGNKRWMVTAKEVRLSLIVRAESVHAPDWRGLEVSLYAKVCKSPGGGKTWGVRVRPTLDELNEATLAEKMQRAADKLPPDQRQAAPERQPGEDEPEPDTDTTEPPDGRQPGDAPIAT